MLIPHTNLLTPIQRHVMKRPIGSFVLAIAVLLIPLLQRAHAQQENASRPQAVTPERASAIADTVRHVFDEWNEEWRALNFEGIMQSFADEGEVVLAVNGSAITGRESIAAWIKEALEPVEGWSSLEYGEAHIEVLGAKAAVHTVEYDERYTLSSGETVEGGGVWTNVFKQTEDGWKVVLSARSRSE